MSDTPVAGQTSTTPEDGPRPVAPIEPGHHTVVVGGGPAGLTAAYLLSKKGYKVTVFEGSDMLGGISQTAQYNGYRFDIGGHRFFTKVKQVEDMWHEVLSEEFLLPTDVAYIVPIKLEE